MRQTCCDTNRTPNFLVAISIYELYSEACEVSLRYDLYSAPFCVVTHKASAILALPAFPVDTAFPILPRLHEAKNHLQTEDSTTKKTTIILTAKEVCKSLQTKEISYYFKDSHVSDITVLQQTVNQQEKNFAVG